MLTTPYITAARKSGFTLVELLVVISIISILSTIGVVTFQTAQKSARDAQRKNDLKVIQYALVEWKQDNPTGLYASIDGSSNNFVGLVTYLNTNAYLTKTVKDPRDRAPYIYSYTPDDTNDTFTLQACLENNNDAQGVLVTVSSECAGVGSRKLVVTKP